MEETQNNPEQTENTEPAFQSEDNSATDQPTTVVATESNRTFLIVGLVVILALSLYFMSVVQNKSVEMTVNEPVEFVPPLRAETGPKPVELGEATPEEFPADLIVAEEGVIQKNEQRVYEDTKLTTSNFTSPKSVEENFEFYKLYLLKNKWQIINITAGDPIYSLYAGKDGEEINITVSSTTEMESGSRVIISLSKASN